MIVRLLVVHYVVEPILQVIFVCTLYMGICIQMQCIYTIRSCHRYM